MQVHIQVLIQIQIQKRIQTQIQKQIQIQTTNSDTNTNTDTNIYKYTMLSTTMIKKVSYPVEFHLSLCQPSLISVESLLEHLLLRVGQLNSFRLSP